MEKESSAGSSSSHGQVSPDFLSVILYRRIKKRRRPGYEERRHLRLLQAQRLAMEGTDSDVDVEPSSEDESEEDSGGDDCHGLRQAPQIHYELKVCVLHSAVHVVFPEACA